MIDWKRVHELRDEVGAEDFDEVVEIFIEEVDEVIERLKSGASTASLEEDLHFLKGSCMNLGFSSFSTLCKDGEEAAAAGNLDAIDLNLVYENYASSRSAFLAEVPNL